MMEFGYDPDCYPPGNVNPNPVVSGAAAPSLAHSTRTYQPGHNSRNTLRMHPDAPASLVTSQRMGFT